MYENAYLTRELPGIGGEIKAEPADFRVTEVPLYPAIGEGEHVYAEIEKRGMTTFDLVERISRALRVPDRAIGYAGLKDSRAITRQVISIHAVDTEAVEKLSIPNTRVHWVRRHRNKLRIGHLKGNRFRIRVRDVVPGAAERCQPILDYLVEHGVPNAFGVQRFGSRRDAHRIGRALCLDDAKGAVQRIVGRPSRFEHNRAVVEAREKFEAGELEEALRLFPRPYATERALVAGLLESGGRYELAVRRIPKKMRRLYIAAFQSHLFNMTLWRRLDSFGRLLPGDLAYKHANGAVFAVSETMDFNDLERRLDEFDISPSGPLHGYKMTQPIGAPRVIEEEVLRDEGFDPEAFLAPMRAARIKGERRALRIPLIDAKIEPEDEDLEGTLVVSFELPRGSYATIVMREIMKAGDDSILLGDSHSD